MATSAEAQMMKAEVLEWIDEYKIYRYLEDSKANLSRVAKMDPRLVWSGMTTCDSEQFKAGVWNPQSYCGCWQVTGWYLGRRKWDVAPGQNPMDACIVVTHTMLLPCPSCNPNWKRQRRKRDCPGDTALGLECEDMFIHYSFEHLAV